MIRLQSRSTRKANSKFFRTLVSGLLAASAVIGVNSLGAIASTTSDWGHSSQVPTRDVGKNGKKPTSKTELFAKRTKSEEARVEPPQISDAELLAEYAKPSVIQIASGCVGKASWSKTGKTYSLSSVGMGSGYFVNSNGYIITNAHVTELSQYQDKCEDLLFDDFVEQLAQDQGKDPDELFRDARAIKEIGQKSKLVRFKSIHLVLMPNGDKLPFEVKLAGAPFHKGKDVSLIKVEVKNAPVLQLANSEQVQLLDHVVALGYPAAADSEALRPDAAYIASITDGTVSAKKNLKDGSPVLQISAPATHGNSGGPVLNNRGEVIGMVTFRGNKVDDQEVSGFTFIVPANTVMEFLQQAGVANEDGPTDQMYREGLKLLKRHHYKQAMEKFEAVRRLFPQHSEVGGLIQLCQERMGQA